MSAALTPVDGQSWTSDRLAISRQWTVSRTTQQSFTNA
jgi:hypothetical protein